MLQSSTSRPLWFTPIPIAISILVYVFLLPIYSCFFIYRAVVILIWKLTRPDLDSIVSDYDAIFTPSKPGQSSAFITLCLVVNGEVSDNRIRQMFQERVAHFRNSSGELTFRRLSQTFITFLGYMFWKSDTEFRLENHIRNYDYHKTSNIPKPSDHNTVQETLSELQVAHWNPNRSPWELLVVSDYNGHQTLLICRVDHFLCDAFSLIELFRVLFQSPFSTPSISRNNRNLSTWDKFRALLTLPYEMTTVLPILLKGRTLAPCDPSGKSLCHISQSVSISTIKTIKKKYNVEFATIMHSATNAALQRALEVVGKKVPRVMDIGTVTPVPGRPDGLCNHWISFLAEYPCQCSTSVERLSKTEMVIKQFETGLFSVAFMYGLRLVTKLPVKIIRFLLESTYARAPSLVLSSFPTSTSREFVDGMEVVDAYAIGTVTVGIGVGVVSWGVNNRQRMTFWAPENALKSPVSLSLETLSNLYLEDISELHGYENVKAKKDI